jgi:hypothetical protein
VTTDEASTWRRARVDHAAEAKAGRWRRPPPRQAIGCACWSVLPPPPRPPLPPPPRPASRREATRAPTARRRATAGRGRRCRRHHRHHRRRHRRRRRLRLPATKGNEGHIVALEPQSRCRRRFDCVDAARVCGHHKRRADSDEHGGGADTRAHPVAQQLRAHHHELCLPCPRHQLG